MDRPATVRRSAWRRLWPAAVAAALLAAGGLLYPALSRWLAADRSVDLERVRIATVVRGDLERDLSVQGRVVAAYHPTLFSPASGIVRLHVRAGDVVEQDRLLAVVDSPELDSRLKQEQSSLLSLESALGRGKIEARQTILADRQAVDLARVDLEAAERAMRRAERTREEGILNEVEFEKAQDDLRRAGLARAHAEETAGLRKDTLEFEVRDQELAVERQQLVVDELRRQVGELSIRAPVAGLVSRLDVDDHDAVNPGQALIGVVDLSAFEVEVLIPESYADEIGPGTPAEVILGADRFAAEVKSISPEVEGSQVRGIVAFTGAAPEGLRQNQRLSTRLVLESRLGVLKVARGPFLEAGGGREAYRVEGNLAERVPIEAGGTSVAEVEIVSGLREGDRIIVSDTSRFERAQRVFLRN
jgi:HlyD family secretion protein